MKSPLELKNHYRDKLGKDIWSLITLYIDIKMKYALLLPDLKKISFYFIRIDFNNIEIERIKILYFCQIIYDLGYDITNIKYFWVKCKKKNKKYIVYNLLVNIKNINLAKKIFNKKRIKIIKRFFNLNLYKKKDKTLFQLISNFKPILKLKN